MRTFTISQVAMVVGLMFLTGCGQSSTPNSVRGQSRRLLAWPRFCWPTNRMERWESPNCVDRPRTVMRWF